MKSMFFPFLLGTVVCLSIGLFTACDDDDDDNDDNDDAGDDDDDNTTGAGCAGICQRGYECFGDEYGEYDSMDECIEQCESDMASLDEATANCIYGCTSITDCEDWAACTSACAGY